MGFAGHVGPGREALSRSGKEPLVFMAPAPAPGALIIPLEDVASASGHSTLHPNWSPSCWQGPREQEGWRPGEGGTKGVCLSAGD